MIIFVNANNAGRNNEEVEIDSSDLHKQNDCRFLARQKSPVADSMGLLPASGLRSAPQHPFKKIFDEHPSRMDGLRTVILSSVEKWLRVTVVRTRIDEHLVRSFCLFHAGDKIDGSLHRTSIFAAGDR